MMKLRVDNFAVCSALGLDPAFRREGLDAGFPIKPCQLQILLGEASDRSGDLRLWNFVRVRA